MGGAIIALSDRSCNQTAILHELFFERIAKVPAFWLKAWQFWLAVPETDSPPCHAKASRRVEGITLNILFWLFWAGKSTSAHGEHQWQHVARFRLFCCSNGPQQRLQGELSTGAGTNADTSCKRSCFETGFKLVCTMSPFRSSLSDASLSACSSLIDLLGSKGGAGASR